MQIRGPPPPHYLFIYWSLCTLVLKTGHWLAKVERKWSLCYLLRKSQGCQYHNSQMVLSTVFTRASRFSEYRFSPWQGDRPYIHLCTSLRTNSPTPSTCLSGHTHTYTHSGVHYQWHLHTYTWPGWSKGRVILPLPKSTISVYKISFSPCLNRSPVEDDTYT